MCCRMSCELRIIASAVFLSVLLAPNWLCLGSLGPWLGWPLCQLQLQLFGLQTGCCLDNNSTLALIDQPQYTCYREDIGSAPAQQSSWHSGVLLRGLAVLLLFSTTAHITRNAATTKLLLSLSDRFALFLRVAVQIAICADLLSSRWASTAAPVTGATFCPAAAAGRMSAQQHLRNFDPAFNHSTVVPASVAAASPAAGYAALAPALTAAARSPAALAAAASPAAAAVGVAPAPALPRAAWQRVSTMLYRPQQIIAGTFLLNHLAFFSHSIHNDVLAGILELAPLCTNLWLLPNHAAYSSSGSGCSSRSLLRLLLLAVVSRVLLPLLAGHMQLRRHAVRHSSPPAQQQQRQQQQQQRVVVG